MPACSSINVCASKSSGRRFSLRRSKVSLKLPSPVGRGLGRGASKQTEGPHPNPLPAGEGITFLRRTRIEMMTNIRVVGAGFSGLVTAYYLARDGFEVQICEQSARAGGLIKTIRTPHGLVETAANGLLNSTRLEALCADIGVPLLATRRDGRKRFIFRGQPRRLPLNASDVFTLGVRLAASATSLSPRQFETIAGWGRRVLGRGATNYLLVPALGGIYAGDPERLSASLIFGRAALPDHLRTNRPARATVRGTVAPPHGMQQLVDGLSDYLKRAGVEFVFNRHAQAEANEPTVVCLSARNAAEFLAA